METIVTPEDDFPGRLLHQAALWDNYELLEDLLQGDQKAHINSQDSWGRTPLHAAALTDKSKCLRLLLTCGADPDIPCGPRGEFRTALHISAECGHMSNVELLLQYGSKLTAKDKLGLTPLDLAERSEQKACVFFLQQAANEKETLRIQLHMLLREACVLKDTEKVKSILKEAGSDVKIVVNMAPNGSNTLLFLCTEANDKNLVNILLDYGADGRFHPVTKYSPLYTACYNGYLDCTEILLKKFPDLVRLWTVEKWLPIHAACIGGHIHILEILLHYDYPEEFLVKYCDFTNNWEYKMPFDINSKDASGQTVLYLACLLGNLKMVEALLKFKVKASKINRSQNKTSENVEGNVENTSKRRISGGIQNIMHRLNLQSKFEGDRKKDTEKMIRPVGLDFFCSDAYDTALHVAIRNKHRDIALLLLNSGADPNLSTLRATRNCDDDSDCGSCLEEACKNRDITLIDSLLKYGARDDSARALKIAVDNKDDILLAKLLAIRAHVDPEYKLNKKAMTEQLPKRGFIGSSNLTYSSVFPNTPVMINWHGNRCHLTQVKINWLVEAALHINPKLKLNLKNLDVVLFAITRLDLSNNALTFLPLSIFQLPSLRYLNLSQNKLEKLPCENEKEKSSPIKMNGYNLPVIEELCCQNNRLESVPEQIFNLSSLTILDLSNNKLQTLPANMWTAPQLKELNVSLNLLKNLPVNAVENENKRETRHTENVDNCDVFEKKKMSDCENFAYSKSIEMKELKHVNIWSSSVEITEQIVLHELKQNCSQLTSLNLAHNSFDAVPPIFACLAVNLTRLNLSYNGLTSMGQITSYPFSLKQLDLSYNCISNWFDLPSPEPSDPNVMCYSSDSFKSSKVLGNPTSSGHRGPLMNCLCPHRRQLKLENLRTLILANNNLEKIQLSLEKDVSEEETYSESLGSNGSPMKAKLLFPSLSMLDLSNNKLKEIVCNIQELTNLSVLNISGNPEITELPPQMGLLSRLWNLNTTGCNLQEPLKSMIESKKYKTMDIIGYLKSVLEDARPYARIKLMIVGVQGIGKTSLLEQLRMEGLSYKRKSHDHWVKRMGSKNINIKTSKGVNMSTVGVDIGLWVYDKKGKGQSSKGPVIFRTWDFGGQREYYATHQYFLSKRSLYLVVWKIPDGQKGIREIRQWLVNIQARAPNSPVLIVGTHYDEVVEKNLISMSEDLQQIICNRFINVVDAEKCGLPRVLDTIEVSCRTRHNIKFLCNLIYDTVYSLKYPGSKELLLEQRVPASYLALEDVIIHLAADRRANGTDPVLNAEQYKTVIETEMQYRYHKSFRDWPELHQATLFLHENGVLLHYEDATLRNLYFLDPQWLCDMLAHVVTIREINPFARTGIMKLSDLKHVFKSSNVNSTDTRSYIVNLLNKFEVALTWDNCSLLIPSLLPSEEDLQAPFSSPTVRVKIPVRSRGWAVRAKKLTVSSSSSLINNTFYTSSGDRVFLQSPSSAPLVSPAKEETQPELIPEFEINVKNHPEKAIRRFLLMSYFPSGFWSRLITRMLGDDAIIEIVRGFFLMPKEMKTDFRLAQWLDIRTEWILWQTGMSLQYGSVTLFRMKEILLGTRLVSADYRHLKFRLQQEGTWVDMDLSNSSIMEIYFPVDSVLIKRTVGNEEPQVIHLNPNLANVAKLLALAIDHIDILLEDWYPTLGTRFVHTSEGKFLVTRLIPCPKCWSENHEKVNSQNSGMLQHLNKHISDEDLRVHHKWHSQESVTSDGDSGVEAESVDSSRKPSVDDHPDACEDFVKSEIIPVFSWMVEECILAACKSNIVMCPTHGEISLALVAPDTLFIDLGERHLIKNENITRGLLLGRGAFGFVFKGTCKVRGLQEEIDAALKMLQPVQPGLNARHSALMAYKVTQGKWDRDPLQYACKAYCTARQELNILLSLRHPNIVPLIGVCPRPLALILDLAPQGALDNVLRNYRRCGAKLMPDCLQEIILQVAKAIEYLHQQHIIYRDLKSENVLVWSLPPPFQSPLKAVHVKLADYGISRLTLPSGSKGFGGTEGFMAPEIMKYNGEEEYTEKVDCFSFGMFIYELLTLHQPFEGHESVKECILEGGRPPLTFRETMYPSCILDLMVLCWAQKPRDRPSASQIVSIASSPEFIQLYDCTVLDSTENINSAASWIIFNSEENTFRGEFWFLEKSRINLVTASQYGWDSCGSVKFNASVTSLSLVNNEIWIGDCKGNLYAYQPETIVHCWKYVLGDAPIVAILFLEELNRVAVGLSNGRLFLVRSDVTPSTVSMAEGSFVMTELGSSEKLFSLAHIQTNEYTCEIWVGEASGYISIFTITDEIVTGHDCVNHYNPIIEKVDRVEVVSSQGSGIYSYVYPGCMVYQWDSREITSTLDCTKLVPCSESLKPITIEDLAEKCQVTTVSTFENCVYVGTAWGCVIVAERACLYPLMVFRPFEEEVQFILPLFLSSDTDVKKNEVILGGKGYRSLSARNTDMVLTPNQLSPTHPRKLNIHLLLWKHSQ